MKKIFSMLFAILAVMAMAQVFVSCEKETDYEEPDPKLESEPQITFTTNKNIGETIRLAVALNDDVPEIIGVEIKDVQDWEPYPRMIICELTSKNVTIKGPIKRFWCDDCGVTSLDVSKHPNLRFLTCNSNLLTTIDVSKNVELIELECAGNQLSDLDISKNTKLQILTCSANSKLTTLDLSNNPDLRTLYCSNNKMEELDVSKNTKLSHLGCYYNNLTSLDLTNNPKIELLYLMQNKIKASEMSKIINTLPDWTGKEAAPWDNILDHGSLYILSRESTEGNEILDEDKKIAEAKNWVIYR